MRDVDLVQAAVRVESDMGLRDGRRHHGMPIYGVMVWGGVPGVRQAAQPLTSPLPLALKDDIEQMKDADELEKHMKEEPS